MGAHSPSLVHHQACHVFNRCGVLVLAPPSRGAVEQQAGPGRARRSGEGNRAAPALGQRD